MEAMGADVHRVDGKTAGFAETLCWTKQHGLVGDVRAGAGK
jgi:hypothetical protein